MTASPSELLQEHQRQLAACTRCPDMIGPVILGHPVASPVLLIGQAPGAREGLLGRPFAWTAGKTLFKWFAGIGLDEDAVRRQVYMAAVCRCFPGKNPKAGDRVPNPQEIAHCAPWLARELELLRPQLLIPVGKLAIGRLLAVDKLSDVIGRAHRVDMESHAVDVIPLPHPSGASTWHRVQPGMDLLEAALRLIASHPAWFELVRQNQLCTVETYPE